MICPKHGTEMVPYRKAIKPRHPTAVMVKICPSCQDEMHARIVAAKAIHRRYHTSNKRRVLPPAPTVMMPRD
jgi:hypothetical protein